MSVGDVKNSLTVEQKVVFRMLILVRIERDNRGRGEQILLVKWLRKNQYFKTSMLKRQPIEFGNLVNYLMSSLHNPLHNLYCLTK